MIEEKRMNDHHTAHGLHVLNFHPTILRVMRFLESINIYFFLNVLLVFSLYILGNFQKFMDSTLLMLMSLLQIGSILCALTGGYYFFFLLLWMVRRRKFLFFRSFYSLFSVAFGLSIALGINFITVILEPIAGYA
jgi:hypothetical protein